MLNNLFIDTDIFLDLVLEREDFYYDSSAIFREFENSEARLYTSPSIIINVQYTGQKLISKERCRATINYLLNYLLILEADIEVIKNAYMSKFTDVEDAIQYYTAIKGNKIDFFITRNTKDFRASEPLLPVLTPSQYLKRISKN